MSNNRTKQLFKVAKEFNVSTQSVVDELKKKGIEVENRPNTKITPDMYEVLGTSLRADKEKSLKHEKAREEYESRRSSIRANRNESVSVDTFLEPLDDSEDGKDADKSPALEGLEPIEDKAPKAPALDPIEVPKPKKEPKVEAQEPKEEVKEIIEEAPVKTEAKVQQPAGEATESTEEKTQETQKKKPKKKAPEIRQETDGVIRGRASKLQGPKVVGKVNFTTEPEKPKEEDQDAQRKKRKKRRRKRRPTDGTTPNNQTQGQNQGQNQNQNQQKSTGKPSTEKKTDGSEETKEKKFRKPDAAKDDANSSRRKKGKKGKKGAVKEISTEDVDNKMRETMRIMQNSGNTGKQRSKRRRERKEERQIEQMRAEERRQEKSKVLEVTEFLTASDFADLINVSVNDIIMKCMSIGMMISINQRLDASTIELVGAEYGYETKFVDAEQIIDEVDEIEDAEEDLKPRAPIVTVMGHVDHGKTSLLDHIRNARVASGEAGGITQHIGAYRVSLPDGRQIAFLDTPGHEAFTAMRSRGAQATDVVILVVAADDSVMPQTIEAINHAKAAGVPIVVALNKVDKPESNPEKIMQQLSEQDVLVEDWGGTYQCAKVSAKHGTGIDELLDKVLIEAELLELKANPDRRADGIVLEARLDKGKGVVANVLVQKGTLKVGDPFVAGPCYGKVRAMINDKGEHVQEAGPSYPIELLGFQSIPQAGDKLIVPKDEKTAREIANQRLQLKREQDIRRSSKHLSLDEISKRMAAGEVSELNIILKADVDGSIEAISGSLQKLGNEEVSVNIIHTGAGAISESDVLLASASNAIIIGFQVRPTTNARKTAEREEIDIRLFSVIYDAIDEVKLALEGMLSPEEKEVITGNAEVRETFKVPNVGTIAGCYVTDGKLDRNQKLRLIRDGIVTYDGEFSSLKRFKDDVKEVKFGFECGIGIRNFNDIKVGDVIESYKIIEEKRYFED